VSCPFNSGFLRGSLWLQDLYALLLGNAMLFDLPLTTERMSVQHIAAVLLGMLSNRDYKPASYDAASLSETLVPVCPTALPC